LIRFAFLTAFNAQEVGGDSLMAGKLISVSEVVRSMRSGSHIALGGCLNSLADSEGKSYNAFSDCRGTAPPCRKKIDRKYVHVK
jgi:hypothetical protein